MWQYQKKLQIPVNIKKPNPKLANFIISQYGGPDGELSASMRYLSQRFSMKDDISKALLTDIGTEELAHLEIVGALVHQLTKNASTAEIENSPLALYYIDHGKGVWPTSAAGQAYTSMSFAVKGDPIADLVEDLAAEQKARVTYDNILRMSDDPDVNRVIAYLREREIVHFQRFGEALDRVQKNLPGKSPYHNC
ncbi:MAG: manganese catalase family protein [Ruminococcaceae bacterium]|nr:manganese catalase family protein [Oscillospiraceae bacterium]